MPWPRPMRCQLPRCSSVASNKRGNHVSGAASSRPSAKMTTRRSSFTATSMAVASNLTAEVDIPGLQKAEAVFDNKQSHTVELMNTETARFRKAYRFQPEFRNVITVLDVNMRRF